jgi:NAD(P)-dependent dehydrogenase (short-subunit alcohol dehydrogenase family)
MARVWVTGSADGLGRLAAELLVRWGHDVVLHARSRVRARDAEAAVPGVRGVLVGDLSSLAETRGLAEQAAAAGPFDAVIHNAGVGYQEERRDTADGIEHIFAINVLAPYVLTALVRGPRRLVYLGSGMHRGARPELDDVAWRRRRWNGSQAYAESKLHDVTLAFAIARRWPAVHSNAVDPGWVPTRMGGRGAPDDLALGADTQAWLAAGDDAHAAVSGRYLYHRHQRGTHPAASEVEVQEALLRACRELSGVALPDDPA